LPQVLITPEKGSTTGRVTMAVFSAPTMARNCRAVMVLSVFEIRGEASKPSIKLRAFGLDVSALTIFHLSVLPDKVISVMESRVMPGALRYKGCFGDTVVGYCNFRA
jgi:hypothetical protein